MTIKKSIFITLFLSAILFVLQLYDLSKTIFYNVGLIDVYYIESTFIILIYAIVIFYANNFRIYNVTKNLFTFSSDFKTILKLLILTFSLVIFFYSYKALLNYLLGDLDTFLTRSSFKLLIPSEAFYAFFLFPFVEELLFRKSILQGLTELYSNKKSILISSFLFALVHLFANADVSIIDAFVAGVILGYVYLHFGFLYSFILHILFNVLNIYFLSRLNDYILSISQHRISFLLAMTFISFLCILFLYYKDEVKLNKE